MIGSGPILWQCLGQDAALQDSALALSRVTSFCAKDDLFTVDGQEDGDHAPKTGEGNWLPLDVRFFVHISRVFMLNCFPYQQTNY